MPASDLLDLINEHSVSALARARLRAMGVPIEPRITPLVQLVTEDLVDGFSELAERAQAVRWDRDQAAAAMMLVGDYETLLSDLQQVMPGDEWAAVEPHLSGLEGQIAHAAANHGTAIEDLLADNLNCNLGLIYPSYDQRG
jgi:hypothetical protein